MTREQIKEKMEEREEFIVSILKEDLKHSVSGKSIEDACGITSGNRQVYMRKLMKKYPQIQNTGAKEAEYKWVEDIEPAPKKNHEGYSDPTPKKAIDSVSQNSEPLIPGEVWSTIESNGASQPIFVLNSLNGAAQCMKLYHENAKNIEITGPDYFQIDIFGISYIGDPSHVTFKPLRYCTKRIAEANDVKLKEARWMIARVLGIDIPETKEIVKEVPVEDGETIKKLKGKIMLLQAEISRLKEIEPELRRKDPEIPDGYVDCRTAEIAILTEQRDIWKTVAMKLLGK